MGHSECEWPASLATYPAVRCFASETPSCFSAVHGVYFAVTIILPKFRGLEDGVWAGKGAKIMAPVAEFTERGRFASKKH
jgi:hypothetical protein